ncbi:MAG: McbB family protein [Sporolactobacillus sp.]
MFKVNNFITYELPTKELVVQNQDSITKVSQEKMKLFLINISDRYNKKLSEEELSDYFGDLKERAISFLLNFNLIEEQKVWNYDVNNICLVSNCQRVRECIQGYFNHDFPGADFSALDINEFNELSETHNTLFIVFLNPYSLSIAKKIKKKIDHVDSTYLIMSYVYDFKMYMDCLYNAKWNNPSHFDHKGYIESSIRSNEEEHTMTYQDLIDMIYQNDQKFTIELPLTQRMVLKTTIILIDAFEKFFYLDRDKILHPDELTENLCFDYKQNKLIKDTALFWELSDIYEQ